MIITFQVGGVESYRWDVEIPRRYGVDQTVGDTVGPGGVFRFLRSVPAYQAIAADALEVCPDAVFINYANPMAMATGYLNALGLKTVGLCHSVQGTTRMLARTLGVPYEEVSYVCAGINHQAWVLSFRRGSEDLYPRLREVMTERHVVGRAAADLVGDDGDHSEAALAASTYEGGNEQVRTTLMNHFGYFETESSHHASEYLPYFRKDPRAGGGVPAGALGLLRDLRRRTTTRATSTPSSRGCRPICSRRSSTAPASSTRWSAARRPWSTATCRTATGLITNLPPEACVEVPCLVDHNGVQPTAVGALPLQLAALNRTNIGVQTLAVQAALTGDRENVYHAVAVDPLTAAICTLEQARSMTDELFEAHGSLLPAGLAEPDPEAAPWRPTGRPRRRRECEHPIMRPLEVPAILPSADGVAAAPVRRR